MITYFKKCQDTDQDIPKVGIFLFLLAVAFILVLMYWDVSFAAIQKENGNVASKNKSAMIKVILVMSLLVLISSFCIDVLL